MRPTVYLGGPCDAYHDLGWGWRAPLACELEVRGVTPLWPWRLRETDGRPEALRKLAADYAVSLDEAAYENLARMRRAAVVLVRLDGREGAGTLAESAVARWTSKRVVVWAPRADISTHTAAHLPLVEPLRAAEPAAVADAVLGLLGLPPLRAA